MFIIIFVPMNKVKLLVHGRGVFIEQQQVVQARVIWYVPCMHKVCFEAKGQQVIPVRYSAGYLSWLSYFL